jgi:AbrB family looped-hinge helix DNA binding protein
MRSIHCGDGARIAAHYRWYYDAMAAPQSKVTAQGQISVPADIRRKFGFDPGTVLEWHEDETGRVFVRKAGKYTFEDIRKELFPDGPPQPRSLKDLKRGIGDYIRKKHARR